MMANPQTEHGYTMIANELFDALINFRICGEHRQVFDFIIRKTYGFKKKNDAIPLSQFVKATGIQKAHVIRAINTLKSRNMIEGAKTGTFDATIYGINKDYTQWLKVPKRALLPIRATKGAETGTLKVPIKAHSKETLKETIQKKEESTAFPEKTGDSKPFYLTKKKKKLTGWKLECFELFWKAFHWPKGKAEASDAWLQIPGLTQNLATEKIIPAATHEAEGRQGLLQTGHTPKWAQGWLSGRRWEDELPLRSKESGIKCRKCKRVVSTLISGLCVECKEKEDL